MLADAELRRSMREPPELRPTIDADERFLVRRFLRRYVTYCARRRRFIDHRCSSVGSVATCLMLATGRSFLCLRFSPLGETGDRLANAVRAMPQGQRWRTATKRVLRTINSRCLGIPKTRLRFIVSFLNIAGRPAIFWRRRDLDARETLVPPAPVQITARESVAKREMAEVREFDAVTGLQRSSNLRVEAISQLQRLADIETDFLKQDLSQCALDLFQFVFGHRGRPVCFG